MLHVKLKLSFCKDFLFLRNTLLLLLRRYNFQLSLVFRLLLRNSGFVVFKSLLDFKFLVIYSLLFNESLNESWVLYRIHIYHCVGLLHWHFVHCACSLAPRLSFLSHLGQAAIFVFESAISASALALQIEDAQSFLDTRCLRYQRTRH